MSPVLDEGIDCLTSPRAEGNRARSQKQSRRHQEAREKPREQELEMKPPQPERKISQDYER